MHFAVNLKPKEMSSNQSFDESWSERQQPYVDLEPDYVYSGNEPSFPGFMDSTAAQASESLTRPYVCTICGKRFTQKAHLITHKRTHTGEKPYACHICHKRFAQSSHLNTHKRIHTGEKPYFCTLCKVGYCRKQRLELHLLQHSRAALMAANIPVPDDHEAQQMQQGINASNMVRPDVKQEPQENDIVFPGFDSKEFQETVQMAIHAQSGMQGGDPEVVTMGDGGDMPAMYLTHRRKPSFVNHISNSMKDKNLEDGEEIDVKKEDGDNDPNSTNSNLDDISNRSASNIEDKDVSSNQNGNLDNNNSNSGDDADGASVTSESNFSGSELGTPSLKKRALLTFNTISKMQRNSKRPRQGNSYQPGPELAQVGVNSRICLVNFTSDDLITHMMSRDDVYRCDFCCIIFQDAAMYHLHRSQHDKMDIRCCNLCGKLSQDKYDFTAHFLNEHK